MHTFVSFKNIAMDYNTQEIEQKWKEYWKSNATYAVTEDPSKPKYYILDMFPYPSGAGLHVGHPLGYIASDIIARYKRQKGYNVLHPMGFDAFGLPAEQYAIQTGVHPAVSTDENIKMYISQLNNIGFNYDWSRSFRTSDPGYYRWTQWIFTLLYDHYYDMKDQQAKSITDLIATFESHGNSDVNAACGEVRQFSASEWQGYSVAEKHNVLMAYRLAYKSTGYVNWCEELGTVLSNDEVKNGVSERGGFPVERRPMEQWSLRITAYAERLLGGLETLEWSDALKTMQRNWIGKSEGAEVFFDIDGHDDQVLIFTTRPDTMYGATFMVLAPEHDLVAQLTTPEQKTTIEEYIAYTQSRSEVERMSEVKEVTGAFTGSYAINPVSGKKIPIYIADYVLKDYGSGAIMAVPSDDERDHRFACKYEIEIIPVVDQSEYPNAERGDKVGKMINSEGLNGLDVKEAIKKMLAEVESRGIGKRKINYKLRDANFSRQRYWGEPFPVTYDEKGVEAVLPLEQLPLELPDVREFKPASGGQSPLATAEEWVKLSDGSRRETNTMPGFAGSSWYFLRYMDPHNDTAFASRETLDYWQDVDLYIGGTEHAVGHLMYSRFWHKFLYDLGKVPTQEPFKKLVNQGMIQGVIETIYLAKEKRDGAPVFYAADSISDDMDYAAIPVHIDFVTDYGKDTSHLTAKGIQQFMEWRPDYAGAIFVNNAGEYTADTIKNIETFMTTSEVGKMSKSKFNVVNPDAIIEKYGADCFRMYEMFLGPIEQSKPWDTNGIDGVSKFLRKFWNLYHDADGTFVVSDEEPSKEAYKILHSGIKKISDDIDRLSLNTCVSTFMETVNNLRKANVNQRAILDPLVRLIAPFAPFLAEELYRLLGGEGSVHHSSYPVFDESYLVEDEVEYPLCINGKKRDTVTIDASLSKVDLEGMVADFDVVKKWTEGKTIRKIIVVPGRMINVVVG